MPEIFKVMQPDGDRTRFKSLLDIHAYQCFYRIGTKTTPKLPNSWLFGFSNLVDAKSFCRRQGCYAALVSCDADEISTLDYQLATIFLGAIERFWDKELWKRETIEKLNPTKPLHKIKKGLDSLKSFENIWLIHPISGTIMCKSVIPSEVLGFSPNYGEFIEKPEIGG